MSLPGRNDPCHCGSGKKYKKCHLVADRASESARLADDGLASLHELVQSPHFADDAPTPAAADRLLGERATLAPPHLDGLDFAGLARLLHYEPAVDGLPLVDGEPDAAGAARTDARVALPTWLPEEPGSEAAFLMNALFEELPADRALALTRSGFLPRAVCRRIAEAHASAFPDSLHAPRGAIAAETDFDALHVVRLSAEDAGLLERGDDGVLSRSASALATAERSGARETFPRLLRAYATRLDWAYRDALPEAGGIQSGWLVGLRLVRRHCGEARTSESLSNAFLSACPDVVQDVLDEASETRTGTTMAPEEGVGVAMLVVAQRLLVDFADFFGLVTHLTRDGGPRLDPEGDPRHDALLVQATERFDELVRFDDGLLSGPTDWFDAVADAGEAVANAREDDVPERDDAAAPSADARRGDDAGSPDGLRSNDEEAADDRRRRPAHAHASRGGRRRGR